MCQHQKDSRLVGELEHVGTCQRPNPVHKFGGTGLGLWHCITLHSRTVNISKNTSNWKRIALVCFYFNACTDLGMFHAGDQSNRDTKVAFFSAKNICMLKKYSNFHSVSFIKTTMVDLDRITPRPWRSHNCVLPSMSGLANVLQNTTSFCWYIPRRIFH